MDLKSWLSFGPVEPTASRAQVTWLGPNNKPRGLCLGRTVGLIWKPGLSYPYPVPLDDDGSVKTWNAVLQTLSEPVLKRYTLSFLLLQILRARLTNKPNKLL